MPLDRMGDAERVLCEAAKDIPSEVCDRLDIADELSDEDREIIVQIARKSLLPLQS